MSHVDDGQLDALLDGAFEADGPEQAAIDAHVASCADCRSRLEEARRLKERAAAVLRAARPRDVPMPSFEELIASRRPAAGAAAATPGAGPGPAGATAPAAPSRRRPIHRLPLAWAATLVLAVSGGWMAHELLQRDPDPSRFDLRLEAPRDQTMDALSREAEAREEAGRGTGAISADSRPARSVVPAPEAPAQQRAFADENEAKDLAKKAEPVRANSLAATPPVANALAGAPPAASAAGRTDASADRLRDAGVAALAIRQEADSVSFDLIQTGDASAEAIAQLVSDYASATGNGGWTTVSVAEASSRLGRPVMTIPGLEVESVQVAAGASGPIARVMQRIDAATVAEVVQRAETIAGQALAAWAESSSERRPAAPARPDPSAGVFFRGRAVLSAVRPGVLLLVSAPVSADSLRALSDRVR